MKMKFISGCHAVSKVPGGTSPTSPENSSGPICRICHGGESEEELVAPCRCTGSMAGVHRACLERWLSSSNTDTCEICEYKFVIFRQPMSFSEWVMKPANHEDCRNLAGDILCFALLTPLAAVSSFLCFTGAKSYVSWKVNWEASGLLCLSLILMAIYFTWCTITVRYHIQNWRKWRTTHQNVHLIQLRRLSDLSLTDSSPNNEIPLVQMPAPIALPINTCAPLTSVSTAMAYFPPVVEMTNYPVNRGSNYSLLPQVSTSGTPSVSQTLARASPAFSATDHSASLDIQNQCLQPLLRGKLLDKHEFMDETQV